MKWVKLNQTAYQLGIYFLYHTPKSKLFPYKWYIIFWPANGNAILVGEKYVDLDQKEAQEWADGVIEKWGG